MRVSKAAAADTEDSNLNSGRDECDFGSFSVGVQTLTEIEELRLRSSHPVKRLSDQHRGALFKIRAHCLSVRQRSDSNKCFLCESEATATITPRRN